MPAVLPALLHALVLLVSAVPPAFARPPALVITMPGIYDGRGAELALLYVRASDVTVRNYHVTGAGPGTSCVRFEGDRIHMSAIEVSGCGAEGVRFHSGTDNVLEDSFIRDPITRPGQDSWGIYQSEAAGRITVRRVRVLGSGFSVSAPRGTALVEDSEFVIPGDYRTDCKGNLRFGGPCQCGEFGIALKSGNVTILRNRISGYRRADAVCGGTGSPGAGIDPAACGPQEECQPIPGVVIEGNVITDSNVGIYLGPQSSGIVIRNNVLCGNEIGISDGFSDAASVIAGNAFYRNRRDYHRYGSARAKATGRRTAAKTECG